MATITQPSATGSSPSYHYPRDNAESKAAVNAARAVIPVILKAAGPIDSIVDIGCGFGEWLYVCKEAGVKEILGADGSWVDRAKLLIPVEEFTSVDCAAAFDLPKTFDMALCLELAEHVPAQAADALIASLTKLAPIVLWSAAIPDQGGKDHINEQWPSYWAEKFARHGFVPVEEIRNLIWDRPEIIWWYKQNLLLYVHTDRLKDMEALKAACAKVSPIPSAVIHPDLFIKEMHREVHVRDAVAEVFRALGRAWRHRTGGQTGKADNP